MPPPAATSEILRKHAVGTAGPSPPAAPDGYRTSGSGALSRAPLGHARFRIFLFSKKRMNHGRHGTHGTKREEWRLCYSLSSFCCLPSVCSVSSVVGSVRVFLRVSVP